MSFASPRTSGGVSPRTSRAKLSQSTSRTSTASTGDRDRAGTPKPPEFNLVTTKDAETERRESSRKQAIRVSREYAEKTRSIHKKVFAINQKELAAKKAAEAKKRKETEEEERKKAERSFREQLKQQEAESRAMINNWRAEAATREKARRVRVMARRWRTGTIDARVWGPYKLPRDAAEAEELFAKLKETPRGAVVAFLLSLFKKSQNRQLGNKMLALALHPDCVGGDGQVRKFTLKSTAKIDSQILGSYAVASHPLNGYRWDPDAVKFEFDNFATPKIHKNVEGETEQVFLVTSGPLPTYPNSRPVEVKFANGKWGVRTFLKLTTGVKAGVNVIHSSTADHDSDFKDYQPVKRDEHESWTAAPDFAAARRRAKMRAAPVESEEDLARRHERAAGEVTGLGRKLAHRDIRTSWESDDPNAVRRIVDQHGIAREMRLADLDKHMGAAKIEDDDDPDKLEAAAAEEARVQEEGEQRREEERADPALAH